MNCAEYFAYVANFTSSQEVNGVIFIPAKLGLSVLWQ